MLIGEQNFGDNVLGGLVQGTPIFPPVSFGETSCVSISNQVEVLSIVSKCTEDLDMIICAEETDFIVFNGTAGVFGVFLLKNGLAIADLSFINRVVLSNGTNTVDSSIAPVGTIWWTDLGEYLGEPAHVLNFKLGGEGIPDGISKGYRITVYDAVNANGIVYADNLSINFVAPEQ